MKTINLKFSILFVLFASLFISCDNDELDEQTLPTLSTIFASNAQLGSLSQALSSAGLTETLNGSDEYTVFAPTDEAFASFLSSKGYSSLGEVPSSVLRELLLNHVIVGKLTDRELPASGYLKTLGKGNASETNTLSMYVNKANGVKLNGVSTVSTANINADNGVVHIVDAVIDLPTVVTHVNANPNFAILLQALSRDASSGFVNELSSSLNAPYTVFAPYNLGFSDFLTEFNIPGLASISQGDLENVLKYHVVLNTNALSSGLSNNQQITTFANDYVTMIINNEGVNIKDTNNREANASLFDVQCSNGVIHGIDKVLVPNFD